MVNWFLPIKLTSICLVASSGIGNIFLNIIGTKTHVITALKIKIPDISEDIVPSCSAIFAEAITKDNVEVNRNAEEIVVFISNHLRIYTTGINLDIKNTKIKNEIIINNDGSFINVDIFKSTPPIKKNIEIKNPYQNKYNFSPLSPSGPNNETITPA